MPDEVQTFLDQLPIRVIPGIGPKTEALLQREAIRTVADLRRLELATLRERFGKWGHDLFERAHGRSDAPVSNEWERKSVGEQETFAADTLEAAFILERAHALAAEVYRRLVADGFRAFRTVTVTVRFTGFVTVTRSQTGQDPASTVEHLKAGVRRLLEPFFDARENPNGKKIRLIGVRVEKLLRAPEAIQPDLSEEGLPQAKPPSA
jgi:nucleotidyltransferase/DNA polymerase involved in DNA repair